MMRRRRKRGIKRMRMTKRRLTPKILHHFPPQLSAPQSCGEKKPRLQQSCCNLMSGKSHISSLIASSVSRTPSAGASFPSLHQSRSAPTVMVPLLVGSPCSFHVAMPNSPPPMLTFVRLLYTGVESCCTASDRLPCTENLKSTEPARRAQSIHGLQSAASFAPWQSWLSESKTRTAGTRWPSIKPDRWACKYNTGW